MSEIVYKDQSIHEPTTAHQHPLETIPQGSQSDGVLNGHDKSDVNSGALAKVAVGLLVLIAFSLVSMWIMMGWMLNKISEGDTVPSQTFVERPRAQSAWPIQPSDTPLQAPNETPALMPDPETPMVELREQDEGKLQGFDYAKDDRGQTTGVTLPIDRAIDLTIERGLPTDNKVNVKIGPSAGEPVAIGEIPYSKKIFMAEDMKRAKKPAMAVNNSAVNNSKTVEGLPTTRSRMSTPAEPNVGDGAVAGMR